MSIGTRIKQRREELGLTQPILAQLVGVSKGSIGNYEIGVSNPNEPILIKLFEALNCDANYLYQDYINIESNADTSENEITPHERDIINSYREQPESVQNAICKMLDVEYPISETIKYSTHTEKRSDLIYRAARSDDNNPSEVVETTKDFSKMPTTENKSL